jgi:ankyrin repeat protein
MSCRKTKLFCALCNQWRKEQLDSQDNSQRGDRNGYLGATKTGLITAKQIEAFDFMFSRGIMAAARNDLVQWNNTWPLDHINITSAEMLRLMIQHGANPLERDVRGTTLLHWAAGTGNLEAVQELLPHFPNGLLQTTERDGATPLHWAAAGANAHEFGTGGHVDVCQFLLLECERQRRQQCGAGDDDNDGTSSNAFETVCSKTSVSAKELVNQLTKDGNSPLMWAAWSGSLNTVKLMVRHRAIWEVSNRNGCTVAHWAASGGNLQVCKYLFDVVGVDFFVPNHAGNTPLTHAVAFGRVDVVQWLRECSSALNDNNDDLIAKQLAEDFVNWADYTDVSSETSERRKQVLQLFDDFDAFNA